MARGPRTPAVSATCWQHTSNVTEAAHSQPMSVVAPPRYGRGEADASNAACPPGESLRCNILRKSTQTPGSRRKSSFNQLGRTPSPTLAPWLRMPGRLCSVSGTTQDDCNNWRLYAISQRRDLARMYNLRVITGRSSLNNLATSGTSCTPKTREPMKTTLLLPAGETWLARVQRNPAPRQSTMLAHWLTHRVARVGVRQQCVQRKDNLPQRHSRVPAVGNDV